MSAAPESYWVFALKNHGQYALQDNACSGFLKRFNEKELKELKEMVREGHSLKKIARALKQKKTTVYYHFRKLKGRTYFEPEIAFCSEREEREVLGIFAGDGSLCFEPKGYHYVVRVHVGIDLPYAKYVRKLFTKCLGKKFTICRERNKFVVQAVSKKIYYFLLTKLTFDPHAKSHTVKLPLERYCKEFRLGFLKGLIDTDGHIGFYHKNPTVCFYTSSKELADQISCTLKNLRIKHRRWLRVRNIPNQHDLHHINVKASSSKSLLELLAPFKCVGS